MEDEANADHLESHVFKCFFFIFYANSFVFQCNWGKKNMRISEIYILTIYKPEQSCIYPNEVK